MESILKARNTLGNMKLSQGFTRKDVEEYQRLNKVIEIGKVFNKCNISQDDIELFVKLVQK